MSDGLFTAASGVLTAAAVLTWVPARRTVHGRSSRAVRSRTARRPVQRSVPAAVLADLLVAVLEAGLPADQAVDVLRHHLAANGLSEPPGMGPVRQALELATRTGVAPGSLVRAAAAEHRRRDAAAGTLAARRLGVLIVLPVGLCLLPAFVTLTVVPLVLALL